MQRRHESVTNMFDGQRAQKTLVFVACSWAGGILYYGGQQGFNRTSHLRAVILKKKKIVRPTAITTKPLYCRI